MKYGYDYNKENRILTQWRLEYQVPHGTRPTTGRCRLVRTCFSLIKYSNYTLNTTKKHVVRTTKNENKLQGTRT